MRCILLPLPVMDQVLCLPQRTTVVVAGMTQWVKLEPGSPFPRLQTPGSRPRLSPRTQAAARRWGSGSGVTQSPGCQVLYQPCSSSHPVGLLHIHLASSTCQPFLVKSCKTPAGRKRRLRKRNTSRLQFRKRSSGFVLLQSPRGVTANLFPDRMHGCPLEI